MNSRLLDNLIAGTTWKAVGFSGATELKRRLASLGIRRDSVFTIHQVSGNHRAVIALGLGQIALGQEVLRALLVEPMVSTEVV